MATPLYADYTHAVFQADTMLRYGRSCGDYALLGGGDTNLYRLFVERATQLTDRDGLLALLTPSGIYGDHSAARFFCKVAGEKRLLALYDFENRRGPKADQFFPDVDSRFKFCTLVTGGSGRTAKEIPCGYLLHDPPGSTKPERLLTMQAGDFALVNPKTGTAPIFLTQRDANIVLGLYRDHQVFGSENEHFDMSRAVVRHVRQSAHDERQRKFLDS